MRTTPPALAMWLLERLATGPHADALIGDLVEAQGQGRSAAWFWAQTLGAIAAGLSSAVRRQAVTLLLVAFFAGLGGAALLGTVKTLPDLAWLDALVAAAGAGWLASRFGGPAASVVLVVLVLLLKSPAGYAPVMAALDHFAGLWLIAYHGLDALPSSTALAELAVIVGGIAGARPRHIGQTPTGA